MAAIAPADFEKIVREHHARVLSLCASLLSSQAEAEDAAAEAFLKAYTSWGSFRADASVSTWLHRIAANECLDRLRARARHKSESWDELLETHGERLHALLKEPSAQAALEAKDLADRVLCQLSPEYRLVLTLREVQGLSYQEIAQTTGDSLDSVKARLKRARAELEEKLGPLL